MRKYLFYLWISATSLTQKSRFITSKVKSVPVFNLELLKKPNTVPQGSINGLLFFNLFTNNSELLLTDTFVNNCADDNYS